MAAKWVMVTMVLVVWAAIASGATPGDEQNAPGPPTCSITLTPDNPKADQNVVFSANAKVPSGHPPVVTWDFGDGSAGRADNTFHRYATSGTYQVECTVVAGGQTTTCRTEITVGAPQSVKLAGAGWQLVHPPDNGDHLLSRLRVRRTDTGEELPFCDAWLAGWVQATLYWYDRDDPGYKSCSCDLWSGDDTLRQGREYFMCSSIDGMELIFP